MPLLNFFTTQSQNGFVSMKFFPLVLFCFVVLGSTTGFYYNTIDIGRNVDKINAMLPQMVQAKTLELELRYRDQNIANLDKKVDANSDRVNKQLDTISSQLSDITKLLLADKK